MLINNNTLIQSLLTDQKTVITKVDRRLYFPDNLRQPINLSILRTSEIKKRVECRDAAALGRYTHHWEDIELSHTPKPKCRASRPHSVVTNGVLPVLDDSNKANLLDNSEFSSALFPAHITKFYQAEVEQQIVRRATLSVVDAPLNPVTINGNRISMDLVPDYS